MKEIDSFRIRGSRNIKSPTFVL